MVIADSWGQIRIEPKYEKIINSKEFNELKNKTQLGLNCNSNAIHTRYQHSIGTYYLACKLIEISKNKFSNILNITKEDEEAIKCMALVHDIGHGCFSHVSEKYLEGTHEKRTVSILLNKNTEINQVISNTFGEKVLQKTINLIRMKEKIKEKCSVNSDNNLMLIMAKLLSGGIDIDRIDYIFRDSKYVTGEVNDFSSILESIDLECIDDSLEVVFDESAEFTIANFFNKRFELYDCLYLDNQTKILESVFSKFLLKADTKLNWDTSEVEINNIFREALLSKNEIIKRYACLLSTRKIDDNFIVKEINDKNSYDFYKAKLYL
jgi:HD superfamily phosphohydrolase